MADKITIVLGQKDHRDFELGEIRAVSIPPQTEQIEVTPTTSEQVILPSDKKYINRVDVKAVTADIDPNITENNIRQGVTILGKTGNLAPDKPDQTKTVTPTKEQQEVVADTGYELGKAIVNPIPDEYEIPVMYNSATSITPSKEVQAFETAGKKIATNLTVEPIPNEFADITGVTATAEDVLNGKTFVDNTGATIQGTAELKEDLDTELTAQENAIADLETAVDNLPEPKPSGANIEATLLEDGSYSLTILEA